MSAALQFAENEVQRQLGARPLRTGWRSRKASELSPAGASLRGRTHRAVGVVVDAMVFGVWIVVPIAIFVALAIAHDRCIRGLKRAQLSIAHYERCIARVQDEWAGTGRSGDDLQPAEHPYAADLDLFGKGSLFELLCSARTRAGEHVLANWLTSPANPRRRFGHDKRPSMNFRSRSARRPRVTRHRHQYGHIAGTPRALGDGTARIFLK